MTKDAHANFEHTIDISRLWFTFETTDFHSFEVPWVNNFEVEYTAKISIFRKKILFIENIELESSVKHTIQILIRP